MPEAELLALVKRARRVEPPAPPVAEDFAAALWELKADPRASLGTVWLRLGVRERGGPSLAEFSRRYRSWLARQPAVARLPDRAGERLVTSVIPVPSGVGRALAVYAAQVGASGLILLELGEGIGEDRWRVFVRRAIGRLGGRPLRAVVPLAVAGSGWAQRGAGEVMGCQIAPPDSRAEQVLQARLEAVRGQTWPAGFGADRDRSDAILRSWEDEVNGAPLPGLGPSSRELFECLDRKRLRPLPAKPASVRIPMEKDQ